MSTVIVEQQSEDVIKMIWASRINDNDVRQSFKEIDKVLSAAARPMFVVVDISADPKFPLTATLTGALFGPQRNPNLREWLVIGSNDIAKFIDRTLTAITHRNLVRWFKNEAEVTAYIQKTLGNVA